MRGEKLIILKILAILAGVLISSAWLGAIISVGVTFGLDRYFEKYSSERNTYDNFEEDENEGN